VTADGARPTPHLDAVKAELAKTQAALAASQADLAAALDRARAAELDAEMLTDAMPCGWCDGVGVAPAERFGRDVDGAPVVDEDQPCPAECEVADWLKAERNDAADTERERDEARAELVSARKELEHRRNLGVELEKLRDIVHRCSACSAALWREEER
jgi:hypothetical protein